MDLEKAYDRVPREELRYCGFKSGLAETYVRQLKDIYEDKQWRGVVVLTDTFKVGIGLQQGSILMLS